MYEAEKREIKDEVRKDLNQERLDRKYWNIGSGQIITSCALLPSKEDVGSETVKALTQVASLTTFFRKLPENA